VSGVCGVCVCVCVCVCGVCERNVVCNLAITEYLHKS
jgi:hypothetical protein